ncbi:MAG: P-loop NTPase fold protein [Burkholderiaceae bacterium]
MESASTRSLTSSARRIARQVEERVDGHVTSGDAFVVSVYGEWGIGKTRCLQDIQLHFERQLAQRIERIAAPAPERWVIPVFFDPWQYEHEEHLVIPLLKTIEHTLGAAEKRVEAARPLDADERFVARAETVGKALKTAGGVFGDVAVALLSGFKFKFAPLKEIVGIEIDLSPKDVFEAAAKADEKRKAAAAAPARWYRRFIRSETPEPLPASSAEAHERLARRESLYFDVRTALRSLTQASEPQLRLVVLIDDLDRCLPEKAIQVLESVKLFLNVPGFSFVLAVDDEVVERGIAHRYRPYSPVGGDSGSPTAAPVSGAEYLEKIVHLPVHLHRWTRDEAATFLRDAYPLLFAPPKPGEGDAKEQAMAPDLKPRAAARHGAGTGAQRSDDLAKLVLDAIPLVPRKLIRLAEALEFQHRHFAELGALDLWQPLHAARVVALQQLYPALYRHLRLRAIRYWRMFDLARNDYGEPAINDGEALHELRERFNNRGKPSLDPTLPASASASATPIPTRAQVDTLRENLSLLECVEDASKQRGNPDPIALFATAETPGERDPSGIGRGLTFDEFAQLFLHGLALAAARAAAPPAPETGTERIAVVNDPTELIDRLLHADTLGRREYLQAKPLTGRLPDSSFDALLSGLATLPDARVRVTDIEWLRDIAEITNAEQLLRLYQEHKVLDALAPVPEERIQHA